MGDFKPSPDLKARLPIGVLNGIENHRLVDRITDGFEPVKALKPLFSGQRRRYAGIMLDMVFDYFLIKHWSEFEQRSFTDFKQQCYQDLALCRDLMPPRMALVTERMQESDWFAHYANLEGIGYAIDQVSKRMRFENQMSGGIDELVTHYEAIEQVFLQLFELLIDEVNASAIETDT